MNEQCPIVAPASEYWPRESRCERDKGHTGPHVADITMGPSSWASSRRIWYDVSFPINFEEKQ
jgi:hypothetical protein